MTKKASLLVRLQVWVGRTWPYLLLVVLAGYFGVMAARSVYKGYQDQETTRELEDQLRQADEEIERLQALLTYYKSDAYIEKELRRTLLLRQPGEQIYALPESSISKQAEEGVAQNSNQSDNAVAKSRSQLPIWRQWVYYLSHKG